MKELVQDIMSAKMRAEPLDVATGGDVGPADLLGRMLERDPDERIGTHLALQHWWLNDSEASQALCVCVCLRDPKDHGPLWGGVLGPWFVCLGGVASSRKKQTPNSDS